MKITFVIVFCLMFKITFSQSVAINISGAVSDSSAILDVSSADKGVLIPRMTITQRNAILNPAIGLTIWNLDCDEFQVFNGTIWKNMSGFAACSSLAPPNVKICNQIWTVKNLDVSTYRNGDPIPKVTDVTAWSALTTGAYCYYNNDSATYAATYGKLYNFYAVTDPRGLAPTGWHVPSDGEWNILVKCIDPSADTTPAGGIISFIAGGAMKETGILHWSNPNTGATNISGFTGLPGGIRDEEGTFSIINTHGVWWTSTGLAFARGRLLIYSGAEITIQVHPSQYGYSVRCVKD